MARIKSREDLRKWLDARSADRKAADSVVISSRAALRALPFVAAKLVSNHELMLAAFRANALARFAAIRPSRAQEQWFYDAASSASSSASSSSSAAAAYAAYAAHTASSIKAATYATYASSSASSATSAYAFSDRSSIWRIIEIDVTALEAGSSAAQLARKPLWWAPPAERRTAVHTPAPDWFEQRWRAVKQTLSAAGIDWDVWTDWYDGILVGRQPYAKLPAKRREKLEVDIARIGDDIWNQGAKAANAEIRRLIEEAHRQPDDGLPRQRAKTPKRPEVPTQKPAAIEPVVHSDGRIGLPETAAESDLDAESLAAALQAVKASFGELADDADAAGNIDKRFIAELRRLAERMPSDVPTQYELFRIGHVEDLLNGYGSTVNEEWPTVLAKRYHALNRQFDRTLRQVPKWRAFKRNADKDRLSEEQVDAALAVATSLVIVLEGEDARRFVDPELPRALARLAAPIESAPARATNDELFAYIEAGKEELAADVVESVNNIAKKVSEIAVDISPYVAPYPRGVKRFLKGHAEGFEKDMEKAGPKAGKKSAVAFRKWAKRALSGHWVGKLRAKFPEAAHWLQSVIDFLKSV